MKCKSLCSSLLLVLGLLFGNTVVNASPSIQISQLGQFEIIYIGDLVPIGHSVDSHSWLQVTVNGYEHDPTTITLQLTFNGQPVFDGVTNPINFTNEPLTFNNIDFSSDDFNYLDQDIEFTDWYFNEDFIDGVSGSALASGLYRITIVLTNTESGETFSDSIDLHITNPDAVWLLSPNPAQSVTLPTPVFIWSSAAPDFRIRLCRAEEGQFGGEDVISNQPIWEEELVSNTATYPAGDVPPLQHASTYYWQVFALVHTTSGVIEFPSDIWSFTYNGENDYLQEETLNLLEELFPGQAGQVLSKLNGYEMSGTVMVDGMPMAAYGLEDFLDGARNGEVEVIEITVE